MNEKTKQPILACRGVDLDDRKYGNAINNVEVGMPYPTLKKIKSRISQLESAGAIESNGPRKMELEMLYQEERDIMKHQCNVQRPILREARRKELDPHLRPGYKKLTKSEKFRIALKEEKKAYQQGQQQRADRIADWIDRQHDKT